MKKYGIWRRLFLCFAIALAVALLAGCSREKAGADKSLAVKSGVYIKTVSQSNAGTENGKCEFALTTAAVSFDGDGKVVSCELDASDISVFYTSEGKAVPMGEFSTKRELGDRYGMKAAGAKAEWYEQADAFEKLIEGKTISEIKALVASDGYGNDDVISAGCTISVEDFVKAIEKAEKE